MSWVAARRHGATLRHKGHKGSLRPQRLFVILVCFVASVPERETVARRGRYYKILR